MDDTWPLCHRYRSMAGAGKPRPHLFEGTSPWADNLEGRSRSTRLMNMSKQGVVRWGKVLIEGA
jgi:hypothetical protein